MISVQFCGAAKAKIRSNFIDVESKAAMCSLAVSVTSIYRSIKMTRGLYRQTDLSIGYSSGKPWVRGAKAPMLDAAKHVNERNEFVMTKEMMTVDGKVNRKVLRDE